MLLALVKALLYLGSILFIGAGVFKTFLELQPFALISRRMLGLGAGLGAILLLFASVLEIMLLLKNFIGYIDMAMVWDYLISTGHGLAVCMRLLLIPILLGLVLIRSRLWVSIVFTILGVTTLGTFSWASHGAAVGGTLFMLTDLVHFVAAAAWGSSIVYLALSRAWKPAEVSAAYRYALTRISSLGLVMVLALFLTGSYTALSYMAEPKSFSRSSYGLALYFKLGIVGIIVGIATYNRFKLLPDFLQSSRQLPFRAPIRLEAILLTLVFVMTGILTTRALPHDSPINLGSAFENFFNLFRR